LIQGDWVPQKVEENVTYKINAVEIFSTGTWNGIKITTKDLDSMVEAFSELKEGIRPFLKLGHGERQKLAQNTGLPAIGWITNLYRVDNKLLADFDYIPEKVYRLIKNSAYRKVSCEVYFNAEVDGRKYPAVLFAVALLGAETPGVMNLDDVLGTYQFEKLFAEFQNQGTLDLYSFENPYNLGGNMPVEKTDAELALEQELATQKENFAKIESEKQEFEAKLAEKDQELEQLRQFKAQADADKEAAIKQAKEAQKDAFITELESEKLITPSMKDFVVELISDEQKVEFSFGDKKMNKFEMVKELLKLAHETGKVNFEENSFADKNKGAGKDKAEEEEIKKYMSEKNCDYATAYKQVMKNKKGE